MITTPPEPLRRRYWFIRLVAADRAEIVLRGDSGALECTCEKWRERDCIHRHTVGLTLEDEGT